MNNRNVLSLVSGALIGGLVGGITMLLVAPQSGKRTRAQLQNKSIELRDRTTGMMEDILAQTHLEHLKSPEMNVATSRN